MHETKLCLSLLDLARSRLEETGGGRILALRIEVGEQCGVSAEAVEASFPICAAGTPAEGAELRVERVPGRELILREMEVA